MTSVVDLNFLSSDSVISQIFYDTEKTFLLFKQD